MSLVENIALVQSRIETAARKVGRNPQEIALVAVTKGVKLDSIRQAQGAGIQIFAENRIQEAEEKVHDLPAQWHLVGHLQTNKIKAALELFSLIHSVDSVRLAKQIHEAALVSGKIASVLLEINISGEEQKYGFKPEEIYSAADEIALFSGIRVLGLMGIAPNNPNLELRRSAFKKLKNIFSVCKTLKNPNMEMKHLSMGMSDDYEIAIEEGSNMVRVGRAIFGERVGP